ncbi:MAG: DUF4350 domain-containing protein, partial [Chitinophagales bacterium]
MSDIANMKENRKLNFLVFSLMVLLICLEIFKPQPIDWSSTFSKDDKIPYGNFLLYDLLDQIFPSKTIEPIYQPIYNQLKDNNLIANKSNYIFINQRFNLEELDEETLLKFVSAGNHVFLTSLYFPKKLNDTLHLETNSLNLHGLYEGGEEVSDSIGFNFLHSNLKTDSSYYSKLYMANSFFERFDTLNTTILGVNEFNKANFIQINFGEGTFYIHANPTLFTNYNMTHRNNAEYVQKALSHLPLLPTYWDEYYNVGRQGM